jgi:hypothetical protein
MTVTVRQVFDYAQINRQLTGPNGSITRDTLRRGLRVQARAKHLVQVDQGTLRDSIEVASEQRLIDGVDATVVIVGTNLNYARVAHDGSGIYGPTGRPIVPLRGKFLVFTSRRTGKLVFVKSVQGQHGTKFLQKALPAAR